MWLGVEGHGGSKHFVFFSNTEPGVMCMICACGMLGDEQGEPHASQLPWGLDAKTLDRHLQGLHWCAIAHGLAHANFRQENLGLTV
jgi:hypothetical protein